MGLSVSDDAECVQSWLPSRRRERNEQAFGLRRDRRHVTHSDAARGIARGSIRSRVICGLCAIRTHDGERRLSSDETSVKSGENGPVDFAAVDQREQFGDIGDGLAGRRTAPIAVILVAAGPGTLSREVARRSAAVMHLA